MLVFWIMWDHTSCIRHWMWQKWRESWKVARGQLRFTIESASLSSSRSDDSEPDFGARREIADSCSDSETEYYSQNLNCWTDSFVVLMSDSFEVISLPADMMQVLGIYLYIYIRHFSDLLKYFERYIRFWSKHIMSRYNIEYNVRKKKDHFIPLSYTHIFQ